MRGMIAVDDVIASLPKDRQKKIAARGNELLVKVQRRMTLSEMRKGRNISQAKMAKALWDRPNANIAPGEAKGPAAFHHTAHGGCHGRSSNNDCNISRSGTGYPCHLSVYGQTSTSTKKKRPT